MDTPTITLRRGEATLKDLVDVLDRLGINTGDDFTIHKADAVPVNGLGPFSRNSETSRQAALANYPRAGSQRYLVIHAIGGPGSMTRDSLADHLDMLDSSVDARVWELIQGGFVEYSGQTRKTRSGNDAEVLQLTPKGRDEMEAEE